MGAVRGADGAQEDMKRMDLRHFAAILAADEKGGIGKDGQLPWRLSADMKYFKDLTSKPSGKAAVEAGRKNVVVMGRRTWESIPARFRPLPGRLNVILSTTLDQQDVRKDLADPSLAEDVFVLRTGLAGALETLSSGEFLNRADKIFLIGGAGLYKEAMSTAPLNKFLHTVYITRVRGVFDCDTTIDFPDVERVGNMFRAHAEEQAEEKGVGYQFQTYTRENTEEKQYLKLIDHIIREGNRKGDRTGVGTLSVFGEQMKFNLRNGRFPLLTTKRVFWRGLAEELFWFMRGSTDARELSEKGVTIWDGNGSREFLDKRGLHHREEMDLGPVYGFQWRHFGADYETRGTDYTGKGFDQLKEVVETIRKNPNDRRIILSAWNPPALKDMALPPCHLLCQFYVHDGELSCQMYQRSCDMGLGVPFNIASYALLTYIIADCTGLRPGDFIHSLGDAHVYTNHVEPLQEQLKRDPRAFPTLKILRHHAEPWEYSLDDFQILDYAPYPNIKMEMAV